MCRIVFLARRLAECPGEPGDQLAVTLCTARARQPQRSQANARIHLVLGDIDTHDNEIILCHHPLPSLLGSGSKPLQLFGLRKTPELSLALLQALSPLGATGSVPATGGSQQPPVRTFCQIFGTQGRRESRVRAAPAVSFARCTMKCAHEHTGSADAI